jgi:cytochrome c553
MHGRRAGSHAPPGIRGFALAMLLLTPTAALRAAPEDEALRTRSLAATCAQCHGTDGRSAPGAIVPPLAGRPASVLVDKLMAFRTGSAPSTVMGQLAKGYNDEQIRRLASYFAALPP